MEHMLKTLTPYFQGVASGKKTFEIRRDDRPYAEGDTLLLRDFDGVTYTGYWLQAAVLYVMRDAIPFGLMPGYCLMSIRVIYVPGSVDFTGGTA